MCELSACFSLVTWFSAAFHVLGYPWPNGERGSGKSKWGLIWVMTSYLGEMLLAGGSFAAIRDLADYGATMLFDDAENLGDVKRVDPDKRALMLAGNRRGASIPLKEPLPGGGWRTRWVNAFCPRGFTAINLPDPVLASRSVVLPLARSADAARANRDPADLHRWPCDQRRLQDDLWAMALWLLPEAAAIWGEMEQDTELMGREFEPWRAIFAVARLLERHGVLELEARIRTVMRAYQAEKDTLLDSDWTIITIRAMAVVYRDDVCDVCDTHDVSAQRIGVTAAQIVEQIGELAEEEGFDAEWANARRIGRILKRLRFTQEREAKVRRWSTTIGDLRGMLSAYGLKVRHRSHADHESQTSQAEMSSTSGRSQTSSRDEQMEFDEWTA
jgi:hypothetical protein